MVRVCDVTVYLQLRSGVCPAKVVDDGSQLGASWSAGVADSSVAGEGACY